MSAVAVATVGAAVIGGSLSSSAARRASSQQAAAQREAIALQRQMYEQQRKDNEGYRQAGNLALSDLLWGMGHAPSTGSGNWAQNWEAQRSGSQAQPGTAASAGQVNAQVQPMSASEQATQNQGLGALNRSFSQSDFEQDPGYAFRMAEAQKAMERSAAARGGLQSGGFAKALTRYSQDAASQEYQNAYNRFTGEQTNRFNRLANLAGIGQSANAANAGASQNFANSAGQNLSNIGDARAAGTMGSANAMNDAIGTGMNTWMQYQMMNQNKPTNTPMLSGSQSAMSYGGSFGQRGV